MSSSRVPPLAELGEGRTVPNVGADGSFCCDCHVVACPWLTEVHPKGVVIPSRKVRDLLARAAHKLGAEARVRTRPSL
jgi:hypothetical protein